MNKVSARWVPRLLSDAQKDVRVNCCRELLNEYNFDTEQFLESIVTGDETMIPYYDALSKRESMEWRKPREAPPRRARVTQSTKQIMATIFWDSRGILLIDYKERNTTVNAKYYATLLHHLQDAIKKKRWGKLTRGVRLLHDNAPVHTAIIIKAAMKECGCKEISHLPYGPDLAPSDYYLFAKFKSDLRGRRFKIDEEVQAAVDAHFATKDETYYFKACNNFNNDIPALSIVPLIIGGENASLGEFPHMAALGYPEETGDNVNWDCAGSLISETFVLTAAHCLIRTLPTVVRLGKVDLLGDEDNAKPQDVPVAEVKLHDDYDLSTKANDIALIRLRRAAEINGNVKPICLYTENDDPFRIVVTGWGKTSNTEGTSRFLLKTAVLPVKLEECNKTLSARAFSKPIFETQLCASSNDTTPRDTCEGDSGGPMQLEAAKQKSLISNTYYVVGITSYGAGCGGKLPSIYTRVSKYLDWIENIVWP